MDGRKGEEEAVGEAVCFECSLANEYNAGERAFTCYNCGAANYVGDEEDEQEEEHHQQKQQQQKQQQQQPKQKGRASTTKKLPRALSLAHVTLASLMAAVVVFATLFAVSLTGSWTEWASAAPGDDTNADVWFRPGDGANDTCAALLDGLPEAARQDPALRERVSKGFEAGFIFFAGIAFYAVATAGKAAAAFGLWTEPDMWARRRWRLVRRKVARPSRGGGGAARAWEAWKEWRETHLGRLIQLGKFFALDPLFAVGRACGADTVPDAMIGVALFALGVITVALSFTLVKRCCNRSCCCTPRDCIGRAFTGALYVSAAVVAVLMVLALDTADVLSVPQVGSDERTPLALKICNLSVVVFELALHAAVMAKVRRQEPASALESAVPVQMAPVQHQHSAPQLGSYYRQQPAATYAFAPAPPPHLQQQRQQYSASYAVAPPPPPHLQQPPPPFQQQPPPLRQQRSAPNGRY